VLQPEHEYEQEALFVLAAQLNDTREFLGYVPLGQESAHVWGSAALLQPTMPPFRLLGMYLMQYASGALV